ncbi:MAG: hypothetical protein GDA44_14905 [Prochloron sp. SP5CPC1]|nr:hypothetical protein [Candidatus Paraprochloron terpiosi SP5CPC1]
MAYLFLVSLSISVLLYILRGLEILTYIPGWMILVPMAIAIFSGIISGINKTKRF